jgi:acyl-CoA dehydrogenase
MDFSPSPRAADLTEKARAFVAAEIEPVEPEYHRELAALRNGAGDVWKPLPLIAELQARARAQGLWNLFLPKEHAGGYAARYGTDGGEGLTNLDYAPIAELTGRSALTPHVFNCNAPDTGNMEVLLKYGTDEQRAQWLEPLLQAEIRSAFTMTEPDVASSDATNMAATAVVEGDEVVINGRKWWSTGVGHPDCRIFVFMGSPTPTPTGTRGTRWCSCPGTPPGCGSSGCCR